MFVRMISSEKSYSSEKSASFPPPRQEKKMEGSRHKTWRQKVNGLYDSLKQSKVMVFSTLFFTSFDSTGSTCIFKLLILGTEHVMALSLWKQTFHVIWKLYESPVNRTVGMKWRPSVKLLHVFQPCSIPNRVIACQVWVPDNCLN